MAVRGGEPYDRAVHFFFRTVVGTLLARFRRPLGMWDVGFRTFRVLPTDLDVLRHMNNGVYLSILDIARLDLMVRSGVWKELSARGWYPVVVSETISFRRSLQLWQKFDVETRVLGVDAKAVFVEQRFVVKGEIFARAFMRGRFLKKSGGTVSMAELSEALGVDTSEVTLPAWLARWSDDVVLPPTRSPAPSEW